MFVNVPQPMELSESRNSTAYVRFDSALNAKRIVPASSTGVEMTGGIAGKDVPEVVYSMVSLGGLAAPSRLVIRLAVPGRTSLAMISIQPKFVAGEASHIWTSSAILTEDSVKEVKPITAAPLALAT